MYLAPSKIFLVPKVLFLMKQATYYTKYKFSSVT